MKVRMREDEREPLFIEHEDGSMTISSYGILALVTVFGIICVGCLLFGFILGVWIG